MKIKSSAVAGVNLLAPLSEAFEKELPELLGKAPRELLASALPYSVIVVNDSNRAIALLGVRFDMVGPRAAPYSVIHYADTLRNPEKPGLPAGARRFVCAEPSFTALLLRSDGDLSSRGRNNLGTLRGMLDFEASLDCVAFADGKLEGPDTQGAMERMAEQRSMESEFVTKILALGEPEANRLLLEAAEDAENRARRTLARKLLEGLQTAGYAEMQRRARHHRLKIPLWR